MNEVFNLHGEWRVRYGNTVIRYSWLEKGAAQACLDLLRSGYAVVTPERGVKYEVLRQRKAEPSVVQFILDMLE